LILSTVEAPEARLRAICRSAEHAIAMLHKVFVKDRGEYGFEDDVKWFGASENVAKEVEDDINEFFEEYPKQEHSK